MFPVFEELRFKGYKSFSDYSSISTIKNVNVFIGRNNSGKSSCIDIVQYLVDDNFKIKVSTIDLDYRITRSDLKLMADNSSYWSTYNRPNGKTIIGKVVTFNLNGWNKSDRNVFEYNDSKQVFTDLYFRIDDIVEKINNEINKMKFFRLNAERNITPEKEEQDVVLYENGKGAVNVIHHILNYENYDEELVRNHLLNALNEIMYPDSIFNGITIQKTKREEWEIFLYENENRFPLSKMGSGLKTIILVLLNLLVMPYIATFGTTLESNTHYENIVFAFEELENNLHPALQRRLFDYIYKFSIEHDTTILLTSHSHVAINMFADMENAKLYHVNKEKGKSSIHKVDDFITKCEILSDLDVRASDLLQSNGIIWVEGPSDKVYIKRWLEIWGDKDLVEGKDYQFLYYGGRVLSHFTADTKAQDDNLIKILSTNRNSAIVIDSDICGKKKDINSTKKRIREEFEASNLLCWITDGKEIENYIPYRAINSAYNSDLDRQCIKNEIFPNYITKVIGKARFDKVAFAHRVIEYINDDNSKDILDLKDRIIELSNTIKQWNSK